MASRVLGPKVSIFGCGVMVAWPTLMTTMLEKCANPVCAETFHRLRDGKVFVTEVEAESQPSATGHARQH